MSLAVPAAAEGGLQFTTPVDALPDVCAMYAVGHVTSGGCVSNSCTVKIHDALFIAASEAEQFTNVVPNAKVLPELGVHPDAATPTLSEETKLYVTICEF